MLSPECETVRKVLILAKEVGSPVDICIFKDRVKSDRCKKFKNFRVASVDVSGIGEGSFVITKGSILNPHAQHVRHVRDVKSVTIKPYKALNKF